MNGQYHLITTVVTAVIAVAIVLIIATTKGKKK
jgi:hypothetical protein